jgi:hypothetical protein
MEMRRNAQNELYFRLISIRNYAFFGSVCLKIYNQDMESAWNTLDCIALVAEILFAGRVKFVTVITYKIR